ncbi:MAG: S-layer homology domain-containing protein [Clostridia bacterium]|nr:S-layer homology domain-containing protein [Clostridia bacterium]
MRNFKFLATAIVAAMLACVLAFASFAATTPFTDIDDKNETLSDAVSLLSGLGVAKGTSETTFGTMEHVTRQQMAAFVYRLMKQGKSVEGGSNTTPFTDLEDSTYFSYVSWANGMGIIKGTSQTTFNPKGGITLQDAYTMVIRALGHEDENYVYPFTYIDKAEELGLDNGLDAVVNYTTKLTRGDVAVILYNTFFAETGKEEVKYEEKELGNGTSYVLEEIKYNPTLAEDVYDVEVGNFEVRATPKYAFNEEEGSNDYIPLCDDYEVDMLHLVAAESDEALPEIYCEFASTGLSGAADDYIMRGVKVFYTYEEDKGTKKLDKVYFMTSSHKVIETSTVGYSRIKAVNSADYYYDDKSQKFSDYEKVEGFLTVGNEKIYFFDAPYSYLKPSYTPEMSEDERYELRNEKNVKLIDIKLLDAAKGTYSYYIDETKPVNTAEDMLANLTRVYSNGAYKFKFFDIDGDGIYEYAHYMPATYGFMDGDDDKYFSVDMEGNKPYHKEVKGSDLDISFVPTIYYNDANITGAEFKDGDMVVAYLNPAANIIDVTAVVTPYNGYVSQVKTGSGQVKIDGTTFSTAYVYRAVEQFDDDSSLYETYNLINSSSHRFYTLPSFSSAATFPNLISHDSVGEIFDIYAFKVFGYNCVLWYDHIEDATISFELDELAIPVSNEDNKLETFTESTFDGNLGEAVHYAKVYFNGKVSYLPLNVDEMYPELDAGYENGVFNLSDITGQGGYMAYVDKICKVKVDSNGHYTLIPLLHAEDEDGAYVGINRDSTTLVEEDNNKQFGNDLDFDHPGYIKKIAGNRYALLEDPEDKTTTLLGDPFNGESISYFNITASTRIVIKNTISANDNEVEYLEFDATSFKGSVESKLSNIQYILKGDPDSKLRADLILLYAEATDFEFETKGIKNGWRVVADSAIDTDDAGNYRYYYKLFNPYTGEVEENVPGENYEKKAGSLDAAVANGTIIEIKSAMVDENGETLGVINTADAAGLVYITEYDADESYVGFVPVEAVVDEIESENICCLECLENFVDNYKYYGDEGYNALDGDPFKLTVDSSDSVITGTALYYEITEDTVISVLTSDKAGADAVNKGEFKLAGVDAIAKASKEFKCYNEKVLDRKGSYGTAYAEYVKAYVYASEDAEDEGELPVAEYIIIVVNGGEDMIFTDYDANFFPKTHAE